MTLNELTKKIKEGVLNNNRVKLTFELCDYKKFNYSKRVIVNKFDNSVFGSSGLSIEYVNSCYFIADISKNIVYDFSFYNAIRTSGIGSRIKYLLEMLKEKSLILEVLV